MPRKLRDAVVVVTGASSGIGRTAAHEFARHGSTLILAARREQALRDAARECEILGGRALPVPTDVCREDQVQNLARQAIENFGRIDVWVNNAAVTLFARFEEAPSDVYRKVIETNLFGYIHGARAVMPYFREQGSGVLINVSSVVAEASQPYTSAYVVTKSGIRALGECLRMELALEKGHDIHVCTIMPSTVDTPLFQQSANYTGRAAKAMPPVYPPEQVAREIIRLARNPKREAVVGSAGQNLMMMKRLAPGAYEKLIASQIDKYHLSQTPSPATAGNVFEPMPQYSSVSGGWQSGGTSPGTWALVGLVAAAPVLWYWWRRSGTPSQMTEPLRRWGQTLSR